MQDQYNRIMSIFSEREGSRVIRRKSKSKMTPELAKALVSEGEALHQERQGGDATYFRKRSMHSYVQHAVQLSCL